MNKFEVYDREELILRVTWGDVVGVAHVENPSGVKNIRTMPISFDGQYRYDVSFPEVMKFLERRTVPRTRFDIEDILKRYGIKEYNPLAMCRKSHGRSMGDYVWIKFDDENTCFEDVRLRP